MEYFRRNFTQFHIRFNNFAISYLHNNNILSMARRFIVQDVTILFEQNLI